MGRELKIVLSVFLFFFIFGLFSFLKTGDFITPFFLDNLIVFLISILFWLLNRKIQQQWLLGVYAIGMFFYLIQDSFTALYLSEKFKSESVYNILSSQYISAISIFLYFGIFLMITIVLIQKTKFYTLGGLLIALLTTTFIFLGFDNALVPHLIMSVYLLLFFAVVQRIRPQPIKILDILSAQFILLFLLSTFEYFA